MQAPPNIQPQINNTKASPPQNGKVTHHHDQEITSVSFKTTNATPNKPNIPIPDDELEVLDILKSSSLFSKSI